jgi:carbamoyltransferase
MSDKPIWVAAVSSPGHNSSVCLLKDGEVVFFIEEERLSRIKSENMALLAIQKIKDYTDNLDYIIIDDSHELNSNNVFIRFAQKIGLIPKFGSFGKTPNELPAYIVHPKLYRHHEAHAASAFYNSGFDKAVCIIVDNAGTGKVHEEQWTDKVFDLELQTTQIGVNAGVETESVFVMEYPATTNLLYKRVYNPSLAMPYFIDQYVFEPYIGPGLLYSSLSVRLGHGTIECGKAMGWSAYGKSDPTLHPIYNNGLVNRNVYSTNKNFSYKAYLNDFDAHKPEDWCYAVQKGTEQYVLNLILNAINNSGCKNVVLSGGFMLNCVANYEYLKHLPEGVNLYVDPPASDAGLAIGLAKKFWNSKYPSAPKKQETFYLGPIPNYNFELPNDFCSKRVSYSDIINLLVDGNIVALYQGRSEAGPRALGNRSILFDPRVKDGKDIVNRIKNREWYRPFAGTILKEHVHNWFDMRGLDESPFMMYAVNARENTKETVPAIIHVDGTCRVQTVTQDQNLHYYNLIDEFYKQTEVPILFNTSFNLAGDPLVETMEDAFDTLRRSDIRYLYLPERNELIYKAT